MNLLRHRPRHRDLHLPNGALVKVEVNELATGQHVHDQYGRVHATARPDPIAITIQTNRPGFLGRLRADLKPTHGRRRFARDEDLRLWTPLPEDCLT